MSSAAMMRRRTATASRPVGPGTTSNATQVPTAMVRVPSAMRVQWKYHASSTSSAALPDGARRCSRSGSDAVASAYSGNRDTSCAFTNAVRAAYRTAGFRLAARLVNGDWSILWLRKRPVARVRETRPGALPEWSRKW